MGLSASVYPKYVSFLNKQRYDDSGLDVTFDPSVTDSGDGYDAAIREDSNNVWNEFKSESEGGSAIPYRGSVFRWVAFYDTKGDLVDHPMMVYGEAPDGGRLDRETVLDILPDTRLAPIAAMAEGFGSGGLH